jgi:hypothetical protein
MLMELWCIGRERCLTRSLDVWAVLQGSAGEGARLAQLNTLLAITGKFFSQGEMPEPTPPPPHTAPAVSGHPQELRHEGSLPGVGGLGVSEPLEEGEVAEEGELEEGEIEG